EDAQDETDQDHPPWGVGPAIARCGDAGCGSPGMRSESGTHQKTASFVSETGGKQQLGAEKWMCGRSLLGCDENHRPLRHKPVVCGVGVTNEQRKYPSKPRRGL